MIARDADAEVDRARRRRLTRRRAIDRETRRFLDVGMRWLVFEYGSHIILYISNVC